jgi:hypothetical protein
MIKEALELLQNEFALIEIEGEVRVLKKQEIRNILNGDRRQRLSFGRRNDAKLIMERALVASDLPISKPSVVIEEFYKQPSTTHYVGTAFSPLTLPDNILNLWSGPIPTPQAGDYSVIDQHILEVICSGVEDHYEYHMNYLAHMVQKPEEKAGVMIIYMGGEGTGKGSMCRVLEAIWSHSTLQVSNVDDILGRFTGALERSYIVWLDEAIFKGDRKSQDSLKTFITEPYIRIEEKYQPKREISSYHRCFAATNHKHFGQVSADNRRFFMLQVSENKKVNRSASADIQEEQGDYWRKFYAALRDTQTIPAFLHHLERRDISKFNVNQFPSTAAHKEQKVKSLEGIERFLFEALGAGEAITTTYFAELNQPREWGEGYWISTVRFKTALIEFDKNIERYEPISLKEIIASIKSILPTVEQPRRLDVDQTQRRGIEFPSLLIAREEFERAFGLTDYDWD